MKINLIFMFKPIWEKKKIAVWILELKVQILRKVVKNDKDLIEL